MRSNKLHSVLALVGFFLLSCVAARADEMTALIAQGNEHFKAGEYTLAIESYERVIAKDKESAELYYNLGNAYYKSKNVPGAILNYERAVKLDPNDEDLQFNLKLANLKTVDNIEVIPTFFIGELGEDLKDMFPLNTWGLIAIVSLWLSSALFFIFSNSTIRMAKRLFFFSALTLLSFSLISLGLGYQKYKSLYTQVEAIVFSPSVIVKSAPDPNETDLFLLHEGTKVFVLEEMAEWNKIRLADGSIGWIPVASIEQI